jgi:DNA-directed RNA polymerase I, II, and III subunit RPABC2
MENHPHVKPVFRKDIAEAAKTPRITLEYFTKYEYVALLSARADQLARGARPLVDIAGLKTSDPLFTTKVAMREIEQRKLPMIVRRHMPDGSAEDWSVEELEKMW